MQPAKLQQLFEKDVERSIEGVIKADDEASLHEELDEYVITNEVGVRLDKFLDAYLNYSGANGVWISGFFGSGKSHLLKMLALLLENRSVEDTQTLDLFLAKPKCKNDTIFANDLKRAVDIPSESILFNIDQKADIISKTELDALIAVFVKVFDEHCGYYGKQAYIAQFERELDSDQLFDQFKTSFASNTGKKWEWGRTRAKRMAQEIDKAYNDITGQSASNILDKYRADYRLSIEDFAEQIKAYIDKKELINNNKGFRLNFFVDEVGQYVADNVKLMTNLQTVAESLATKCNGRSWVIVTAQEESKTLEFKRDLSSTKPILKTLISFANTAGGRLIIGVTDDKQIMDINKPLDEEEKLANLIADSISPRLVPNIEMTTVEGKTLLIVEVFLSSSRPHWLRAMGRKTGVFVRLGSTNRQADPLLITELQRGVEGISYDTQAMAHLSINDLDIAAIEADFPDKKINNSTLQSLRIICQEQGNLVPSRGGILLYGKDRRFHFDDAWIQCGRFIGDDKADIFDHIEIHDPLPKAVDSIMLFLKKHAMRGADFTEIRRKDLWSIPIDILREVIINALVHADYSSRGTPIRIAFFDHRIEVESPGLLLAGVTIADMKQGISKIRNPVIARIFQEKDLIEQWGSGIPGIFRQIKTMQLPDPLIQEIAGRVRFTVYLNDIPPLTREQSRKSGAQSKAQSNTILSALADKPLSASELILVLELKSKTGAFKRSIKELLTKGLIEYTITDKPSSRLQKYRLV